jgi:8-amino-7-oxononanoate synthase
VHLLPDPLQQVDRTHMRCGTRKLTYFGGCDYFRLASHPRVLTALFRVTKRYGLSVAASRVTTGNHRIYQQLENELAEFFGVEAAVLLSSGYCTNLVVAQACAGLYTVAYIDEQAHPSLHDASRFLGCPVLPFRHRDANHLARQVRGRGQSGPSILLTDGLFAHSGALAPLKAYRKVLPPNAVLLVDDAHAAGVLGRTGQGTVQYEGLGRRGVIQTITLSKAFGAAGGAIVGTVRLRQRIVTRSAAFCGSTPLALPLAGAARQALKLLSRGSWRRRLNRNVTFTRSALRDAGIDVSIEPSPILGFRPRHSPDRKHVERALLAVGIHPPWIRYVSGPSEGYFRFAISSEHSGEQIGRLVTVLIACQDRLTPVA